MLLLLPTPSSKGFIWNHSTLRTLPHHFFLFESLSPVAYAFSRQSSSSSFFRNLRSPLHVSSLVQLFHGILQFVRLKTMGGLTCLCLGLICLFSLTFLPFARGQPGDDDFPNEIPRISAGSCLKAGLCCPGRDSSCVVQKAPPNSIIEDLDDVPCYCDHGCVLLNDCCSDFKTACGVQDCEVSNWGLWTPCDSDCGLGTMTRTRTIAIEARNGGKVCPSLVQKRGCRGTRCQNHRSRVSIEEAAIILPVEFSEKRKLNESSDITRNLRLRYPKNPAKERSSPYCVEFEVIRSTRACKSLESFISLREGNRICVMCEREAQRPYSDYRCAGTGSDNGIATRFSSLREPACHGKWKHIFSDSICGCGDGARFIFV